MSAIFISHSSKDNAEATEIRNWLTQQGHTSLFLDFDPDGIVAGSDWEQTLYQKLRQCQAVIALLTPNWLGSKWCFAEMVQAREKGKAIFPVKLQPCDADRVFSDIQQLDLVERSAESFQRLSLGLKACGLDPRDVFDWDPSSPPYPGLRAFQESDAAIYFGRGEQVINGLESLDALRRQRRDAPRLAVFLGASGSGKSSLMRAGLIPRLRKSPDNWVVVAPFRPQENPLGEMAKVLSNAFNKLGISWHKKDLYEKLLDPKQDPQASGSTLLEVSEQLLTVSGHPEATVILAIDQAEELFGYSEPEAADLFLRIIRSAMEKSRGQLLFIATLRSDFLGNFQTHSILHDPAYQKDFSYLPLLVDPMPERNFPQVITGPAKLAGLQIESGLVEAMVRDTATSDALPLLAFTLRRLYERYADNGILQIRDYDSLGRLEGSIRAEAERVIQTATPSAEELNSLRNSFVPALVRINAEGGYARKRALRDTLPGDARNLLDKLIDARLLVSDRGENDSETLEVAHEALLRTWPLLVSWLDEDRDKLRLIENLQRAAHEWDIAARPKDLLVHRGGRLSDTHLLTRARRFELDDSNPARQYLNACLEAQAAREAEEHEQQQRKLRDAERIAEEQHKAAIAQKRTTRRTQLGLLVVTVLAVTALWFYREASIAAEIAKTNASRAEANRLEAVTNAELALSRQLSSQARQIADDPDEFEGYYDRAILLALQSADIVDNANSRGTLLRVLQANPNIEPFQVARLSTNSRHFHVQITPDNKTIVATSPSGLQIWDRETAKQRSEPVSGRNNEVYSLDISPDGQYVASGGKDMKVRIWNIIDGKQHGSALSGHTGNVNAVSWSADGKWLATAANGTGILLWRNEGGVFDSQPVRLPESTHDEGGSALAFNPVDNTLAIGNGKAILVWDLAAGKQVGTAFPGHGNWIKSLAFSPSGQTLASVDTDGVARVWNMSTGDTLVDRLRGQSGKIRSVVFSPDGKTLAGIGTGKGFTLWDTANKYSPHHVAGEWAGWDLSFNSGGNILAVSDEAGGIQFWHIRDSEPMSQTTRYRDNNALLSPSGHLLASAYGTALRVSKIRHDVQTEDLVVDQIDDAGKLNDVAFSPDGRRLATRAANGHIQVTDLFSLTPDKQLAVDRAGSIAFNNAGNALAVRNGSTRDGQPISLWSLQNEQLSQPPVISADPYTRKLLFSPDDQLLASLGQPGDSIKIWNLTTGKQHSGIENGHAGWILDIAFSHDGQQLASAGTDGTVRIWDVNTGKAKGEPYRAHTRSVDAIAFSPDGALLAGVDANSQVSLWHTESRKLLGNSLPSEPDKVRVQGRKVDVEFSEDGKQLIVSANHKIRIWDLALEARVCKIARRTLSKQEWLRYLGDREYAPRCSGQG